MARARQRHVDFSSSLSEHEMNHEAGMLKQKASSRWAPQVKVANSLVERRF